MQRVNHDKYIVWFIKNSPLNHVNLNISKLNGILLHMNIDKNLFMYFFWMLSSINVSKILVRGCEIVVELTNAYLIIKQYQSILINDTHWYRIFILFKNNKSAKCFKLVEEIEINRSNDNQIAQTLNDTTFRISLVRFHYFNNYKMSVVFDSKSKIMKNNTMWKICCWRRNIYLLYSVW